MCLACLPGVSAIALVRDYPRMIPIHSPQPTCHCLLVPGPDSVNPQSRLVSHPRNSQFPFFHSGPGPFVQPCDLTESRLMTGFRIPIPLSLVGFIRNLQ